MAITTEQVSVGTTAVRLDAPNDKQSIAFRTESGEVAIVNDADGVFADGGFVVGTEGWSADIDSNEGLWVVAETGTVTVHVVRQGVHS